MHMPRLASIALLLPLALPLAAVEIGIGIGSSGGPQDSSAQVATGGLAAQLARPVTLELKSVPFSKAMASISKQSGIPLKMPADGKDPVISFSCEKMDARTVLDWIVGLGSARWKVAGQTVLIVR
jgi:hypothetical protein